MDKAVCSWLCNKVKADVELGPRTWGWAAEHPPGAPSAAWAVQSLSGTWEDSPKWSSYLAGGWNDSNAVYKCRRLSQRQQTKQGERNKTQARHPSLSKHATQKGKRRMPYFKNSYVGTFFAAFGLHHVLRSTGRQQHFPRCPAAWWQEEMLSQDQGDSSHRALRSLSTDHFPSHSPWVCKTHWGTGELGSGERWLCQHMLLIWQKSSPSGLSQRGLPLGSHGGRRPSSNYSTRSSDTLPVAQRDKYPAGGSSLKLWHSASQSQQKCVTVRSFCPSAWSKEHPVRTDGE